MFYQGKVVLVTGGTGFVGTNFVEELLRRGAVVRVPIHHRPLQIKDPRVQQVPADLMREDDCRRIMQGVQYVVHAAGAVAGAGGSKHAPLKGIPANLATTAYVLEAAWAAGVERFLMLGSVTFYPVVKRAVKEEDAWTGPMHPSYFGYGWMRGYLEKLAEFAAMRSNMKVALTRPTAVYGRWDDFDPSSSHVVPALIRKALTRLAPYEVWGTGDEVRDFLHVSDLVYGGLLALEKYAECSPVNLGYGKSFTIRELVQLVLKAADYTDAQVVFDASKPTTIPFRMVDISKARRVLGFAPKVSLEEGIADTVRWYREALQSDRRP